MKTYMPLDGFRWSCDSDSALCDMRQTNVLGRAGGGEADASLRASAPVYLFERVLPVGNKLLPNGSLLNDKHLLLTPANKSFAFTTSNCRRGTRPSCDSPALWPLQ